MRVGEKKREMFGEEEEEEEEEERRRKNREAGKLAAVVTPAGLERSIAV